MRGSKRGGKMNRQRRGTAVIETIMVIGSLLVLAILAFWLAESAFAGLFHLISGHNGSPYL